MIENEAGILLYHLLALTPELIPTPELIINRFLRPNKTDCLSHSECRFPWSKMALRSLDCHGRKWPYGPEGVKIVLVFFTLNILVLLLRGSGVRCNQVASNLGVARPRGMGQGLCISNFVKP